MKTEVIKSLTNHFEASAHRTKDGIEFWLARDLQNLLGYTQWRNFQNVITRAKKACEISDHEIADHFADVSKMVDIGSGAEKQIVDMMLTRYACYLVAQNGDSAKEKIAFAQTYFAVQTRKYEIIERHLLASERVGARSKLAKTEKELSSVIYQQTGDTRNFGWIRSQGDKALFSKTTDEMKQRWKIKNKPLADFMPTILLKAKDFATEITIFNTKQKKLYTGMQISSEHITNNRSVRHTLISRGITPENLPPEEDIRKVERKLQSENKQGLKTAKKLRT